MGSLDVKAVLLGLVMARLCIVFLYCKLVVKMEFLAACGGVCLVHSYSTEDGSNAWLETRAGNCCFLYLFIWPEILHQYD